MQAYQISTFDRVAKSTLGQGQTVEYRNQLGETLAYIDYNEDRTAAGVVVFDPYKQHERRYSLRATDRAEAIAAKHLTKLGYEAPVEDEDDERTEAQQKAEQQINEQFHDFTEEEEASGLKRLLADVEALQLCPRCGLHELEVDRPALNARSRYAPIAICSPCGTHESLSTGGLDLWHNKTALAAALDEQRASRAAADTALQQSIERAQQARAERNARETLCEITPAQKSALAAAVVWPT